MIHFWQEKPYGVIPYTAPKWLLILEQKTGSIGGNIFNSNTNEIILSKNKEHFCLQFMFLDQEPLFLSML